MNIEMTDCENTILREIATKELKERDVAQTYHLILKSSECATVDWAKVNAAIIERWSMTALIRIKKSAWNGKCFA